MNSYYSVQTGENEYVRIPMISSLRSDAALILGALIASNNANISQLIQEKGELLLGCMVGSILEGENVDLGSPETVSLSKIFVADIVTLLFKAFETLEKSMAEVDREEAEAEKEAEPESETEPQEDDN
jgi:hypothetical protein